MSDTPTATGATGLESIEMGGARIRVDEKRIINCNADLNQLVPFKYHWAWEAYLKGTSNHWMPQEQHLDSDLAQWSSGAIAGDERSRTLAALAMLSQRDGLANQNQALAAYRHITNPECRQYLLRQAFEEPVHTFAYQNFLIGLQISADEAQGALNRLPSFPNAVRFSAQFSEPFCETSFKTGSVANDQALVVYLANFYLVEHCVQDEFAHAQLAEMHRRGLLHGIGETIHLIRRDRQLQADFGAKVIQQIVRENPHVWTPEIKAKINDLVLTGVDHELLVANDALVGSGQLTLADVESHLHARANAALLSIGLPAALRQGQVLASLASKSAPQAHVEQPVSRASQGLSWD